MLFTRAVLFAVLLATAATAATAAPTMNVRDGDGQAPGSSDDQADRALRAQALRNQRMREALEREQRRQAELARQREELMERLRQAEAEVAEITRIHFPRLP